MVSHSQQRQSSVKPNLRKDNMDCDSCKHRTVCDLDPSECDKYTLDPEALLCSNITDKMAKTFGVKEVKATIRGAAINVVLIVDPSMSDETSRQLYANMISRILQGVLDESDGALSIEYATVATESRGD